MCSGQLLCPWLKVLWKVNWKLFLCCWNFTIPFSLGFYSILAIRTWEQVNNGAAKEKKMCSCCLAIALSTLQISFCWGVEGLEMLFPTLSVILIKYIKTSSSSRLFSEFGSVDGISPKCTYTAESFLNCPVSYKWSHFPARHFPSIIFSSSSAISSYFWSLFWWNCYLGLQTIICADGQGIAVPGVPGVFRNRDLPVDHFHL